MIWRTHNNCSMLRIASNGLSNKRRIAVCQITDGANLGKEKIKYSIRTEGSEMIYMAGIYRPVYENRKIVRHECFILTRNPADEIRFIHDRMPVILPREATADWLNPTYAARDVLRSASVNMEYNQTAGQIQMGI